MGRGSWFTLVIILLLSAIPRFYANNWDDYRSLHPDERFLSMVTNDAKVPRNVAEYLDPTRSPINPYNISNGDGTKKFGFFVYGTLPVTITKLTAHLLGRDNYWDILSIGRRLSAAADLITLACWFVILTWLTRSLAWPHIVPALGASIYGLSVLPIQLSHFYTTDTFLGAGCALALLLAIAAQRSGGVVLCGLSGTALGAAIACKISALYWLPVVCAVACIPWPLPSTASSLWSAAKRASPRGIVLLLATIVAARICDPHLFMSSSMVDLSINPLFIANIQELKRLSQPSDWPWPPAIQWLSSTPIITPLYNIFWFGFGPTASILACLGLISRRVRPASLLWLVAAWGLAFFLYQGSQYCHSIRYFLLLYPIMAAFAAHGVVVIIDRRASLSRHLASWAALATALLIWPLAFTTIYKQPHSRIEASRWILDNIPANSILASEHWDDSLPVGIDGRGRPYQFVELPVFGEDTEEKWRMIDQRLEKAAYIVLSSNRGYGSMCQIPKKYPRICAWYTSLFTSSGAWQKIYEVYRKPTFSVGPVNISWDTQLAEEAFSVYDHPRVMVFQRKTAGGTAQALSFNAPK